jgi:zinc protease
MSTVDRTRPPAPGPHRPFHFPPVRRHTLPNGLRVLAAEVRTFPLVSAELVLTAGALHEPAEKRGLASLVSSLLESGAGERNADDIAEAVDGLGLSFATSTSWDTVQVGIAGLRSRLEPGVELLAELALRPTFPAAEVDRLRDERLGSIRHGRADPASLAGEVLYLYVYAPGVPYALPIGGTLESVPALAREDVEAFHGARYRAGGATLCVAGDVSLEEAVELAERAFGDWSGAPVPATPREVKPRLERTSVVIVDRPGAVQSEIRIGHVGVERMHPRYYPLVVLNAVLGGTFSSRLNLNLRERLGYTYGASSTWMLRRQPGIFYMSAPVQTEATAHSVSEMLREVREIREAPVTPAELEDARSYMADAFPLTLQTTDGVASRLTTIASFGLPDDYYDDYSERVLAVTAEDVLETARELLRPDEAVIVVVGDAATVRGELEALGEGPVEVVSAEEILG